jgi:hypothetical protein
MDEKISLEAIAVYGDSYAQKLVDNYFANTSTISGAEILAFSDVQQVNLFIVRELFRTWREETKKLKSPYFDYTHADVQDALNTFMNVLSKYIRINKQHFAPLVKKSVSQTLLVIFNPYDYFSMILMGTNNKMDVASFREELKYLRINKAPLEKLLYKLEQDNITEISGSESFAILDRILEEVHFSPEDPDSYISRFSSVVKMDTAKFYFTKEEEPALPPPPPPRKEEPDSTAAPKKEEPLPAATKTGKPTVHDSLLKETKPTLADNFRKIDRIKDRLTINQKFMFTKVLFQGDFEQFSKAVDELDRLNDMPAALRFLENLYDQWDRESEEFHEFMEMIEKRFS